jgi:hypothetical protein
VPTVHAKNRPGFTATVRGIKIRAGDIDELYIGDDQALAEGWLQTLARLVDALPDDLHRQIGSIDYTKGRWPPDPTWYPGYLIWTNPELIEHAHQRQRLSDLFMRVDGGHPGIGWLHPSHPWSNDKPKLACGESLEAYWDEGELDPEVEVGLWIEPMGWGAGLAGFPCSEVKEGDVVHIRFAELADMGLIKNTGTRRGGITWAVEPRVRKRFRSYDTGVA